MPLATMLSAPSRIYSFWPVHMGPELFNPLILPPDGQSSGEMSPPRLFAGQMVEGGEGSKGGLAYISWWFLMSHTCCLTRI